MTSYAILNNVDHHDLRVVRRHGAEFGDAVNQVLIFPTEFEEAQREFPILFREDDSGSFHSVALVGLDRDENLFLGEDGWQSRYVPAVQQRGPFSISLLRKDGLDDDEVDAMIQVDLDDPRLSRTEGEPLFRPQGGNAPYLDHIAHILRVLHAGMEASKAMFAAFEKHRLIESVAIELSLSDTESYKLPNHFTIAQDRLAALDGDALAELNTSGILRFALLATVSLGNFSRLIDLKNRKLATEQAG